MRVEELPGEPRLPYPGVTHDDPDLPAPLAGLLERSAELPDLGITTDEPAVGTPRWFPAISDRFACYQALVSEKFMPASIDLSDQFRATTVKVTKVANLCNPVDQTGETAVTGTRRVHLVAYEIAQTVPKFAPLFGIRVNDQFGTRYVNALAPDRLLVPSVTSPGALLAPASDPGADYFVCYVVKPPRAARTSPA